MKTITPTTSLAKMVQIPTLFAVTTVFALAFWLSAGQGLATPNQCTFCHKRTTTMTLACTDLDYQRHLDHGDTVGACAASRTAMEPIGKAEAKTK